MRILVTGASGFIGTALCRELLARRHEVVAAVRRPAAAFELLASANRARLRQAVIPDIGEPLDWRLQLAEVEAVVHLAAAAHEGVEDWGSLRKVNVEATRALARAAAGMVKQFVLLSSVKAVADESGSGAITESDLPQPGDAYGKSKRDAEQVLIEAASASAMATTILRPPLVYGPRVRANFLRLMKLVDSGWPLPLASLCGRRSLIYVANLADAICRCLERRQSGTSTYFVSDGDPVTVPQLVTRIAQALGRPARLFPFPPRLLETLGALAGRGDMVRRLTRSLEIDDSLIRRELGWRPPFSPEQGLAETAAWYSADRPRG